VARCPSATAISARSCPFCHVREYLPLARRSRDGGPLELCPFFGPIADSLPWPAVRSLGAAAPGVLRGVRDDPKGEYAPHEVSPRQTLRPPGRHPEIARKLDLGPSLAPRPTACEPELVDRGRELGELHAHDALPMSWRRPREGAPYKNGPIGVETPPLAPRPPRCITESRIGASGEPLRTIKTVESHLRANVRQARRSLAGGTLRRTLAVPEIRTSPATFALGTFAIATRKRLCGSATLPGRGRLHEFSYRRLDSLVVETLEMVGVDPPA